MLLTWRIMVSQIYSLYDPLGLLLPITFGTLVLLVRTLLTELH